MIELDWAIKKGYKEVKITRYTSNMRRRKNCYDG